MSDVGIASPVAPIDPPVSSGPESEWPKWFERLNELSQVKDGWNGYDAPAPTEAAIAAARTFLSALETARILPSRVAPSVVGGIGITKRTGARKVYVEFRNDGRIFALFSDGQSPSTQPVMPSAEGFQNLIAAMRGYLDA